MRGALLGIPLLAVIVAGCGNDTSATAPSSTTTSTTTTEFFAGSLDMQGAGFYSFTMSQAGNVSLLLASETAGDRTGQGPALTTPVGIGLGVPSGTGCALATAIETSPALISQLTTSMDAGIHCAEVHDAGHLTSPVSFVLRIVHP